MSALVKRNVNFIRLLADKITKAQLKAIINTISRDQLKALIEITYNIVHLNIPISKANKEKLLRRSRILKSLVDRTKSQRKVLKIVKANHTTVAIIAQAALPALLTLL